MALSQFFKTLSPNARATARILILAACLLLSFQNYAQTGFTDINITSILGTATDYEQDSPADAINDIIASNTYTIRNGSGTNNDQVTSYEIGATTYDNFLVPDTVAIRRTDGSRTINIWYELITDPSGGVDDLSQGPDAVEDADLIYQTRNLNAGYDNILVNTDDEGLGTIQAQTERVDIIWYNGIVTCEPDNAIFPVLDRGGNDEIKVAAITSLDVNGDPDEFGDLVLIEDSDWPAASTGESYDNFLILRRQSVGQDPLPLANIGTFAGQSAQAIVGVGVDFTELGITANQVVYGYSLFASDVNAVSHTLTDITTFPTNTLASVSGIDLIAGVTAAVSSDECLTPASGPGGYKSALDTWLKANEQGDVTTSSEGGAITDWQDHWIGNHDFTGSGGLSAVRYRTTSSNINFNETADFSSAPAGLSTVDNEDFNTATSYDAKGLNIAFRTGSGLSGVTTRQVIYEQGDNNRGIIVFIRSGNLHVSAWNQPSDGTGAPWNTGTVSTISAAVTTDTEYIVTLELDGNTGVTGTLTSYLNGQSMGTLGTSVGLLFDHTGGGIELGASDGNTQYDDGTNSSTNVFAGEIPEFIYCNVPSSFPLAQRNRIESYLAIKYGITLDQSTPIDYVDSDGNVIFDATNNASIGGYLEYNDDIAGIGRDDGSELIQLKSKSENTNTIITVERTTAFTSDDNYLIWGNDDAATTDTETSDIPNVIARRIERVWRVAETGETGNNDITFDLNELTVTGTPGAADYALLIASNSSDGVFTSATIVTGATIDGTDLTFSDVNLTDGQYFTLATAYATCGPGGLGTADDLALWLKADLGPILGSGGNVETWTDFALSNDATQTSASNRPSLITNSVNFNPAIDFLNTSTTANFGMDGTAGLYSIAYYMVIVPDDAIGTATTGQVPLGFDVSSSSATNNIGGFYLGNFTSEPEYLGHLVGFAGAQQYQQQATSSSLTAGEPLIFEVRENAGGTDVEIAQNGLRIDAATTGSFLSFTDEEYELGLFELPNAFSVANAYDGRIAEVFSYSTRPSDVESGQIESYLAIKYGITLSDDNDNDMTTGETISGSITEGDYIASNGTTVIWDYSTNTSFHNDVAGIGRDDDSCLEQKQSSSVNSGEIVTIGLEEIATDNASNTNSFTADESYLIWGNDAGTTTQATATAVVPPAIGNITERMTRIWRVDETGTVGDVAVAFDLATLGYSSNASNFQLIVSPNSDLSSATTYTGGSFDGDVLTFTGIDFTDGDYFTLGTDIETCGPGGVTGGSVLDLWLKANQGTNTTTDDADITSWDDASTQARNGANDDLGGTLPVPPKYNEDGINFNPSIAFTDPGSTNGGFIATSGTNDVTDDMTLVVVFKSGQGGGSTTDFEQAPAFLASSNDASTSDYGLGMSEGRVHFNADNTSTLTARSPGGTTYNDLEPYIFTGTRDRAASGPVELYVNSNNVASGTSSDVALTGVDAFGIGNLGEGPSGDDDAAQEAQFSGDIAEAIVFTGVLTATEQQRVESYLAIKYGITRDGATAVEDYLASDAGIIWDWSLTSYNSDIAGLGRDDGSCLSQLKSKSENDDALVTMEIGSLNTDDSFMIWGNDNADLGSIRNFERPATINSRINREWFVQETGTVGTVTLTYDLSQIQGPTGVGTNNANRIRLLIDDDDLGTPDGDFSSGVTIVAPSSIDAINNTISFEVDLENGEYFTLGSFENDALPVELLEFTAEANENVVDLNWSTASEEGNANFSIERSADGLTYETIARIDGAGTTEGVQYYQHRDTDPIIGFSFYRLKQTDFSGEFTYSEIRAVHVAERETLNFAMSPNPISRTSKLNLTYELPSNAERAIISIIDVQGRLMMEQEVSITSDDIQVDISKFSKGIYLVRLNTLNRKTVSKRLVIR